MCQIKQLLDQVVVEPDPFMAFYYAIFKWTFPGSPELRTLLFSIFFEIIVDSCLTNLVPSSPDIIKNKGVCVCYSNNALWMRGAAKA